MPCVSWQQSVHGSQTMAQTPQECSYVIRPFKNRLCPTIELRLGNAVVVLNSRRHIACTKRAVLERAHDAVAAQLIEPPNGDHVGHRQINVVQIAPEEIAILRP